MTWKLAPLAVAALAAAGCGAAHAGTTAWTGAYRLPARADPVAVSVELHGRSATVGLGPGHAGTTSVPVVRKGARIRFALPGRPAPVVFTGTVRAGRIAGAVSQGSFRGSFRLAPGRNVLLSLLGLYRGAALVKADSFPPWLVELPSGDVHGIGPQLTVGARVGDTTGDGTLTQSARGIAWGTNAYERVPVRQYEVRFGVLAGTLTLPAGAGPFPAVVMVHGSGRLTRAHEQFFEAFCVLNGIAVLAYDKRGVGESGGAYPGEAAEPHTIDALARDAEAAVRFLAAQPEIDRTRVGLLGDSQAGWIVPFAAAREPAVRWAVLLAGPTIAAGEVDYWATLAGKGEVPPQGPFDQLEALVRRAGPSGFDPQPYLRQLTIPALWIYGDDDRNVPTDLCVEAIRSLGPGHDYSWTVLRTNHSLFDVPSGLNSDLPRSRGFAVGLVTAVVDWLRSRGIYN